MTTIVARRRKSGKLQGDLASIKLDEQEAVAFLLEYGIGVKIVPADRRRKTPDFFIDGKYRELKTPRGKSPNNIAHVIKKGEAQSENLILDARRSPKSDTVFISETERAMQASSFIRSVWIILKSGQLVEIQRKGLRRRKKK